MLARRHKMQEGKVFEERYIAYPDGKISKLDGTPLKQIQRHIHREWHINHRSSVSALHHSHSF